MNTHTEHSVFAKSRHALFMVAALILTGASSWATAQVAEGSQNPQNTRVESIRVQSRLDPNAILITELDVVFVYEAELVAQMPNTKRAWYSNKRNFTRSAAEGLDVVNLFIPQGFDSDTLTLPERRGQALKVLVYAYHDSADAAPADITGAEEVFIEIDPFGIRVTQ